MVIYMEYFFQTLPSRFLILLTKVRRISLMLQSCFSARKIPLLCRERSIPCKHNMVMGERRSEARVGGLHYLIAQLLGAPGRRFWRAGGMFLGSLAISWVVPEPEIRYCSDSMCPHQPPRVLTEATSPAAGKMGCGQPGNLVVGGGGLLGGLSEMACHRIQDSILSKSCGALQWKDEWSILRGPTKPTKNE